VERRDRIKTPDFRSAGTMMQFLREFFAAVDRGYSRREIKEILRADPRFTAMIERGRSGHSRAIMDLVKRREIVELGGLLYGANRAPRRR
jgi:hypothetical protein